MEALLTLRHLLTDGKARKVIVIESTFLPQFVKEEIARALFDNLKVSCGESVLANGRRRVLPSLHLVYWLSLRVEE